MQHLCAIITHHFYHVIAKPLQTWKLGLLNLVLNFCIAPCRLTPNSSMIYSCNVVVFVAHTYLFFIGFFVVATNAGQRDGPIHGPAVLQTEDISPKWTYYLV